MSYKRSLELMCHPDYGKCPHQRSLPHNIHTKWVFSSWMWASSWRLLSTSKLQEWWLATSRFKFQKTVTYIFWSHSLSLLINKPTTSGSVLQRKPRGKKIQEVPYQGETKAWSSTANTKPNIINNHKSKFLPSELLGWLHPEWPLD